MDENLRQLLLKEGYVLAGEIGKGSFGTVYRITHIETQVSYAVKKVDLRVLRMQPNFVMERLQRECSVLESLAHPCVVRLFKTIHANDFMLMIMELVLGFELFEMIVAVNGLSERDSCAVFIQVASSLAYMHSKGIIHRDIKPENILVQGTTSADADEQHVEVPEFYLMKPRVKLIDFGLSKVLGSDKNYPGSLAKSLVGTPRYVAPEIIQVGEKMRQMNRELRPGPEPVSYTEKVDCYSCGVLLHVMLSACFPQFDATQDVIFADERITKVSPEAKDLISKLMTVDPNERWSMEQALHHQWVQKHHPRAAYQALCLAKGMNIKKRMSYQEFERKVKAGDLNSDMLLGDGPPMHVNSYDSQDSSTSVEDGGGQQRQQGTKRQHVSSIYATNDFVNSPSAHQSLSSSRSSIEEVNLPGGLAEGVWGPYKREASERSNSGTSDLGSTYDDIITTHEEIQRDLMDEGTIVLVPGNRRGGTGGGGGGGGTDSGRLSDRGTMVNPERLINLQAQIAHCFQAAFEAFKDDDSLSPGIISSAVASRELFHASETILQKLEQTSMSVLDLLPDMRLAVEEGEIGLAIQFFDKIKEWIKSIKTDSQDLLKANVKVIAAVNNTLQLARRRQRMVHAIAQSAYNKYVSSSETNSNRKNSTSSAAGAFQTSDDAETNGKKFATSAMEALTATRSVDLEEASNDGSGHSGGAVAIAKQGASESQTKIREEEMRMMEEEDRIVEQMHQRNNEDQEVVEPHHVLEAVERANQNHVVLSDSELRLLISKVGKESTGDMDIHNEGQEGEEDNNNMQLDGSSSHGSGETAIVKREKTPTSPSAFYQHSNRASDADIEHFSHALAMLAQIDTLLQKHASFWSHMEVVVDVLMQRANHVESLSNFTRNPRLRHRFVERVEDYTTTWTNITTMCQQLKTKPTQYQVGYLYKFLTDCN